MEELYNVHTARSLDQIKAALSTCELMPQNIMIGTVDGDTFYVHDGCMPIRNHGLPTTGPCRATCRKTISRAFTASRIWFRSPIQRAATCRIAMSRRVHDDA